MIYNSSLTHIISEILVNTLLQLSIMQEMRNGILLQHYRKFLMLMTEHQLRVLVNQFMRCRRILFRISQIILISIARSHLSHAIHTRKVNVSEGTTVAILMTLQLTMITNNGHDHITTSLSQLREMIVNKVLTIKVNLVGLMPSVLLPVDAQTTTHMASQKLKEDNSTM